MENGIIYMYTCPKGLCYIGQTWREVEARAGDGGVYYKTCTYFWNAIQKHGWDNFKCEILHENIQSQEELDRLEEKEIQKRETRSKKGYNIRIGGRRGRLSDETKKKLSENKRKFWENPENVEKMKQAHANSPLVKGRPKRGKEYWKDPQNRLKQSERSKRLHRNHEYRQKVSAALKKRHTDNPDLKNNLRQYNPESNPEIAKRAGQNAAKTRMKKKLKRTGQLTFDWFSYDD